jgi:glyoxylase-like metal-dependent hydrolase (beta-lactamase superfamily II)
MESIAENVFVEEKYPGVLLGVISRPRGLLQIDAPPSPEDGREWRASLMEISSGPERLLINLDAHLDRILGARAMDCTVLAHEKAAQLFNNRPAAFKPPSEETGSEWETLPGMSGIRWAPPEISFTKGTVINWGGAIIRLEHHPGPSLEAIWVILPEEKIVFIGDTVLKNQPPYLTNANIPAWLEALELLKSGEFRGYTIIGGRDGKISNIFINHQIKFLKEALKRLDKLAARKRTPDATQSMIQPLLKRLKFAAARRDQFAKRLRYGLRHYYTRNYKEKNDEDKN